MNSSKMILSIMIFTSFIVFMLGLLFIYDISTSLNFFRTFTDDGSFQTNRLLTMLNNNEPHANTFYNYGNLHHFISFFIAKFLILLGWESSFNLAATALYITQMLAYIATWFVGYLISLKITHNSYFSIANATLIVFSASMFYWSYNIHPDVVQLPFLLASIYFLLTPTYRNILISASFVGLATATKYMGAVYGLMVFIVFIYWVVRTADFNNHPKKITIYDFLKDVLTVKNVFYGFIVATAFIFMFLIPNYSIVSEFNHFLNDLKYESKHVARGHGIAESTDGFLWFPLIWNQISIFLVMFALLLVIATTAIIKGKKLYLNKNQAVLFLAVLSVLVVSVMHLYFSVNMRRPRYIFHLYPLLLVLSSYLFYIAFNGFQRSKVFILIASFVFSIFSFVSVYDGVQQLNKTRLALEDNETIIAGKFIAKRCDSSMKVLLPMYSYIDEDFKKFSGRGYSFNERQINNSDILILNSSVPGRHIWPTSNNEFRKGRLDISEAQYNLFYNKVFNNKDFVNVYPGKGVMIFVRSSKLSMCNIK